MSILKCWMCHGAGKIVAVHEFRDEWQIVPCPNCEKRRQKEMEAKIRRPRVRC